MDQQICLRWNNFHTSFASTFEILWDEEAFCDVTLFCEGQQVSAHKVVLSACSSVFKTILKRDTCQHPTIILHKVSFPILEAILHFIYRGEVNIEHDQLDCLLEAAAVLQIRGLASIAQREKAAGKPFSERQASSTEKQSSSLKESFPKSQTDNTKEQSLKRKRARVPSPSRTVEENPLLITAKEEPISEDESPHMVTNDSDHENSIPNTEPVYQDANATEGRGKESLQPPSEGIIPDHLAGLTQKGFTCRNAQPSPFPCPFCGRTYASWGFRRRHIKSVHTINRAVQLSPLPCKWCGATLPSFEDWEHHVVSEHNMTRLEAEESLKVLKEAHMVLQIPKETEKTGNGDSDHRQEKD